MVVCLHSTFYAQERLDSSLQLFEPGNNGVPLFFAISGFVIVLSSQKLQFTKNGWKIFALKRLIRIVPLYWFITSYKVLVSFLSNDLILHSKLNALNILKSYLFIPTYNVDGELKPFLGVGWTLNFEMLFYLLFALSLFFKVRSILFSGIFLIILMGLSFFKTKAWPPALQFYCDKEIINFLLGMIAANLIQREFRLSKAVSIFFIAGGLVCLFFPIKWNVDKLGFAFAYLQLLCPFFVVYGAAQLERTVNIKIPKFILFFGAASYSLYLVHPVIAPLAPVALKKFHFLSPILSVSCSILLALTAAYFCYCFFERPISKTLNSALFKNKNILLKPAIVVNKV